MVFCVEVDENNVPFIRLGKHQLRLDLEELDEIYKERAKNELNEIPEVVESCLPAFKEHLKEEENLNIPIDDDVFLYKFLRPFKFNAEHAFHVLKKFYKFKLRHPHYGLNITPSHCKPVFDNDIFQILPTRSSTGARIMIINAGSKWNTKYISIDDIFRTVMVCIEIAMMEPKTQVGGVHVIINMEGFTFTHIAQFSPTIAKLIATWVQDCAPVRLHGIHVINQNRIFSIIYAIFKPFLGEKLKKKLYFHGSDRKVLLEHISAEALPQSLGGNGDVPEYPGKLFAEMLFYYEENFKKMNTYCYSR